MNEDEDIMTRYEKARILGTRALQISMGSLVSQNITVGNERDPLAIAKIELKTGELNMIVRRYYPGGSFDDYEILPNFKLRKK